MRKLHASLVALGFAALACGGGDRGGDGPVPGRFQGGAQITIGFGDSGERLEVWTTKETFYDEARALIGQRGAKVPVFDLVDGAGCDPHFTWHTDPATPTFVDATIELCDGLPSHVEADKATWLGTVKRLCPWSGWVVTVRTPVASPDACR